MAPLNEAPLAPKPAVQRPQGDLFPNALSKRWLPAVESDSMSHLSASVAKPIKGSGITQLGTSDDIYQSCDIYSA